MYEIIKKMSDNVLKKYVDMKLSQIVSADDTMIVLKGLSLTRLENGSTKTVYLEDIIDSNFAGH